ncbi:HD domain-containing protein [Streptomyces sp. SID8354]|nr:HD domain-containing protein [Streptomyces sp. SID8354]
MDELTVDWAMHVAEAELHAALPRRWVHCMGVARRAAALGQISGENADLLVAAATLHDVGYAPRLATTGFHPLDGARFLRDEHGADERLVRLVANHVGSPLTGRPMEMFSYR